MENSHFFCQRSTPLNYAMDNKCVDDASNAQKKNIFPIKCQRFLPYTTHVNDKNTRIQVHYQAYQLYNKTVPIRPSWRHLSATNNQGIKILIQ